MNIKFRQGWTDLRKDFVDLQLLRISWATDEEFDGAKYLAFDIIILNFSITGEIPINKIARKRVKIK